MKQTVFLKKRHNERIKAEYIPLNISANIVIFL